MLMPQSTVYAFRVMTQLAATNPHKALSREHLAKKTHVPVHFLAKVMRRLVKAKLVRAKRGVGGGFVLAKPLGQIHFEDILRAVGYNLEENRCAFGWKKCSSVHPCPLHPVWSILKGNFLDWTRKHSLIDLAR